MPSEKEKSPAASPTAPVFRKTGVISTRELREFGCLPSSSRLRKGPVVVVECVEHIPCNPCASACPRQAITITGGLTELPRVDFERCNGCTVCIARCPGLAIFVVNYNYSEKEATVALPYEMLPRPAVGDKVQALDRSGKKVALGRVVRVQDTKAQDRCAVVTVAVPKHLWNQVRSIKVREQGGEHSTPGRK